MSTVEYKSLERRKIVEEGYRLVMNIGDQWSDLDGEPRGGGEREAAESLLLFAVRMGSREGIGYRVVGVFYFLMTAIGVWG